jgi:glucose/arabinose dehydrogenase
MTTRLLVLFAALALAGCGETKTPRQTDTTAAHADVANAPTPAAAPAQKPLPTKRKHFSIASELTHPAPKATPTR